LISHINIKNIALIKELTLELNNGLNVLSGETGAGKSIIIDSLSFVLGDRADRSLIRFGETKARVEVVFSNFENNKTLLDKLEEYDIEIEDDILIVSRLMTDTKIECRINDRIVTLSTLRNIVSILVDIHSQNEHQSLYKVSNHIRVLDKYSSNLDKELEYFNSLMVDYKANNNKLANFLTEEERERQIGLLTYQINEIENINLKDNEEDELLNDRNRYYNSQSIFTGLQNASQSIEGTQTYGGIIAIKQAIKNLHEIEKYDSGIVELIERLDSSAIELEDISTTINDMLYNAENCNFDINYIEERINSIKSLKRKYGKTKEDIDKFLIDSKNELDNLLYSQNSIDKYVVKKAILEENLITTANKLHNIRTNNANKFSKEIMKNLQQLGMKNSVFEVKIELADDILSNMNTNGADNVEFMLSPNLGEPPKPLAKIASGGEISRFMLALKNVIASVDEIDTLIFDEIDTGISGIIAKVVATKLWDIAKSRQVIAITHLPQLASMADTNYLIRKDEINGKTLTSIEKLDIDKVYSELMRLSGAVEDSDIGLSSAKEIKKWAENYKLNSK